jgi:tetratricopeptide (TPR) repeat protein
LASELKFYILERICSDAKLSSFYKDHLREEKDIGKLIRDYPLEAFIERISRSAPDVLDTIAEVFRGGLPNANHHLIARMVEKGFVQEIFTTNFDVLVEKALENIGWTRKRDFHLYYTEDQFSRTESYRHPVVFKIHGSAHDVRSIRVTLELVASEMLSESRAKALRHFLTSRPGDILILGYGAKDDFDINPAMSGTSSHKRIFYVNHRPGDQGIGKLPQAFSSFHGTAIHCDTAKIVNYLWDALGLVNDWRVVIDRQANQIPLPTGVFITGSILYALQQLDESWELYRRAKGIYEKLGDRSRIAITLHQLAMIEEDRGDCDEAEKLHNEGLDIERRLGNRLGVARTLGQLGMVEHARGNYDEAEKLHNRAKKIFEKLGEDSDLAIAVHHLAMVECAKGNYDEAERMYERAERIFLRLGDESAMADTLHQLANIQYLKGRFDEAEKQYNRSLEIRSRLGDKSGVPATLHQLALIEQSRGNYAEAKRMYRQSLEIECRHGRHSGIATTLAQLGRLAEEEGDLELAERNYQEALQMFRRIGAKAYFDLVERDLEHVKRLRSRKHRT